jgi:Plasmid replication region DNA-binding N-term
MAEVHAAADQLNVTGKLPKPPSVRELTGRGSFMTIQSHLSDWIPKDQRLELPPLPETLTAAVSALATDLYVIARAATEQELAARVTDANRMIAEAQKAAADVGEAADRLAADLDAAQKRIAELEKVVDEREQHITEYANYVRELEITTPAKPARSKPYSARWRNSPRRCRKCANP